MSSQSTQINQQICVFLLDNFDSFTYNLVDELRTLGLELIVYRNSVAADVILQKMHEKAQHNDEHGHTKQVMLMLSPGWLINREWWPARRQSRSAAELCSHWARGMRRRPECWRAVCRPRRSLRVVALTKSVKIDLSKSSRSEPSASKPGTARPATPHSNITR